MRFGLVVAFLTLVFAAPAVAGTYDVVTCRDAGPNGVNRSWTTVVEHLSNVPYEPGMFDFRTNCATGLVVNTHSPEQRRGHFSATGAFRFTAPPGTAIVGLRATRYGEARSSSDDPNTPEPEGGDWELFLHADSTKVGGILGDEQCNTELEGGFCTVGAASGSDSGPIRLAPASTLTYGVSCGGTSLGFCFANAGPAFGNYPLATFWLYGATVTLEDTSAPAAEVGGDLVGAGWRRPTDSLTWSASDNVGIRSARILLDGVERVKVDSSCDATRPVPCPNVGTTAASVGAVADGHHELELIATDSAGNQKSVKKPVDVDGNGPSAAVRRASGKTITVAITDGASGVAGATLEVRNRRDEPFRPLPATLANGRVTAKLDRGSASRVGIRINARDNAGNVTAGQLSEMSVRVGGRRLRGGATYVRYGRAARFSGSLRTRDGVPLAGQPIAVEETLRTAGSTPAVVATITTDARGRFSYRAPAGVSRQLRFVYGGGADLAPLTRTAQLRVRAGSTIHASRRVLRGRGRVRFSGRLGLRGATVPPSGKIVELQAFDRGRWRTFATTRARGSKGTWRSSYRFGGTPGRYPVRLRIRREAVFPYDLGYSRSVVVRVR